MLDAIVEIPDVEVYRSLGARVCEFCQAEIHWLASKCPICRRKQPERDDDAD